MNFMKRRNTLTTLALLAAVSHLAATTGPTAYADKKEGGDSNYIDDDGNDDNDDNEKKDDGDDEESTHRKGGEQRDDEGEAASGDISLGPSGTVGIGFGGEQSRISRFLRVLDQLKFYLRAAFPLLIEFWSSLLGLEFVGVFPAIVV
jgi:hypothetical protein